MLRRLLLATLAVLLATGPGTALAAFPGRNGLLAVAPRSGAGIVLVAPDGSRARRICTNTLLCGRPVAPRFSPDGRAIVFDDAHSLRIAIVGTDGDCLWCLLGRPLTRGFGHDPAFSEDGVVTFAQETAAVLSQVDLRTGRTRRLLAAPVSDAATSARGRLAFVRGAWIWMRSPGRRLTKLVRGRAPAWSPGGAALAFERGGWIWTVPVHRATTGRMRRLARGSNPAWAPDGARVAYIAPGGAVSTMTATGHDRRRVGKLRGREVDWQPLPRGATPCSRGNGAIIAQDQDAVVRQVFVGQYESGYIGWNGCLRALGTAHHLTGGQTLGGCYDSIGLAALKIAGRFATLNLAGCDHEDLGCEQSTDADLFDLSGGTAPAALDDVDCRTRLSPVAVDTSGFAAWLRTTTYEHGLNGAGWPCSETAATCVSQQVYVRDDSGTRLVDEAPPGPSATLGVPQLSGNSLTVVWTDNGQPRSLALR